MKKVSIQTKIQMCTVQDKYKRQYFTLLANYVVDLINNTFSKFH